MTVRVPPEETVPAVPDGEPEASVAATVNGCAYGCTLIETEPEEEFAAMPCEPMSDEGNATAYTSEFTPVLNARAIPAATSGKPEKSDTAPAAATCGCSAASAIESCVLPASASTPPPVAPRYESSAVATWS